METISTTHLLSDNGKEFDLGSARKSSMLLRTLTREKAIDLFNKGKRVYFIYKNNRTYRSNVRKICKDLDYLKDHYDCYGDVCGVEYRRNK